MAGLNFCKNCANFSVRDSGCKAYRYMDLVSGRERLLSAYNARYNNDKCSEIGRYFIPTKTNKLDDDTRGYTIVCSAEGCVAVNNIDKHDNNRHHAGVGIDYIAY